MFENKDTVAALVTLTHPGLRQKKKGWIWSELLHRVDVLQQLSL